MEIKEVQGIIEAILFAVGRPVSIQELNVVIDVEKNSIEQALNNLKDKYSDENNGISFVKVKDAYQLVTNKKWYKHVEAFIGSNKKENLSNSAMEVLSIIAYNPKITKSEIESIRGANSDSQVSKLIEYGLIEEVGRLKVPGRPAIFEVTREFLRYMGINNIEEMPDYENMKKNRTEEYENREIEK